MSFVIPSFAFIPIMLPFKAFGLGAIFTAACIGGIFQIFIGKMLKPIRHMFPPLVTGIVVLMIGISLLKVGFKYAGGGVYLLNNKPEIFANWHHLTIAGTVLIVALLANLKGKGMASAASILIGIIAGFIVAAMLGEVRWEKIAAADWFALPMPLQYGIDFVWGAVILMLFMSIVTTIETIGDISATTMGGDNREATNKELSGGIIMFGLIAGAGIKLISKSEMNQRNILILSLSLSFGIGLYAFPEFVAHVPDLGIKLGLLLTTGLIPAGLLAFILNATLPKKSK